MRAVDHRTDDGMVEATTLWLRIAYRRPEELIADHLRYFRPGRLPPVPTDVRRLGLELVLADGPSLQLTAELAPDGRWLLHPGDDTARQAFEEALHALAVQTFGPALTTRLEGMAPVSGENPPARPVSEVGRRAPR
jgi:hypothetical protein